MPRLRRVRHAEVALQAQDRPRQRHTIATSTLFEVATEFFFSTYTFQENTPCLTDRPVAFLAARLADYRPVGRPVTAHIALVRTVARRNALRNAATIEES